MQRATSKAENIDCYFNNIKNFSDVKREDYKNIFDRIKNGDKEAYDTIFKSNLKLVVKIAKKFKGYYRKGFELKDLIQEGNIGLIRAIEKYNVDNPQNASFQHYASFWIRQKIMVYLKKNWCNVMLRGTAFETKEFFSINRRITTAENIYGKEGSEEVIQQLSKKYNISHSYVKSYIERVNNPEFYINENTEGFVEAKSGTESEIIKNTEYSAECSEISKIVSERVKKIIPLLNYREYYILKKRLYNPSPDTLDEIKNVLGVSRQRVNQIEIDLKEKLKKYFLDIENTL